MESGRSTFELIVQAAGRLALGLLIGLSSYSQAKSERSEIAPGQATSTNFPLPVLKPTYTNKTATIAPPTMPLPIPRASYANKIAECGMKAAKTVQKIRGTKHTTVNDSKGQCGKGVRMALAHCGLIPEQYKKWSEGFLDGKGYAKTMGDKLVSLFNFKKVSCSSPEDAPEGAVLVYKGINNSRKNKAGHVEWKGIDGQFYSDFVQDGSIKESPIGDQRILTGCFVPGTESFDETQRLVGL